MKDEKERSKQSANLNEARSSSSTSTWDLRRAEIEWTKQLQEAEFEYQYRLASAFAHYNEEMKAVWQAVRDEELSALNASAALAASSDATPERRVELALEWADRMRAIGRAGNDRAAIVARALAEEQQKAWLDAAEKRRKSYERYVEAIGKSYVPGGAGMGMLAGDEGPVVAMKMFALRGDEGFA
jgi:hypothetical protein